MKNLIKFLFIAILFASCTEQVIVKKVGGNLNVDVQKGYKVTSATWKGTDLFYFIEPMEEDYEPKKKIFVENSSFGVIESKITFIEKR